MRAVIVALVIASFSLPAVAQQRSRPASPQDDRWDLRTDRPASSSDSRDIEMRRRLDPDPTERYRGTIDRDGTTRLRNLDGDSLKGNIDSDGYGRLRDSRGNDYRVRPRQ